MFYVLIEEEKFEDAKGVIRICKLKDRQHNGQRKKNKMTNNLQNTTKKTKDRATQTPPKIRGYCSTSGTRHVAPGTNQRRENNVQSVLKS